MVTLGVVAHVIVRGGIAVLRTARRAEGANRSNHRTAGITLAGRKAAGR